MGCHLDMFVFESAQKMTLARSRPSTEHEQKFTELWRTFLYERKIMSFSNIECGNFEKPGDFCGLMWDRELLLKTGIKSPGERHGDLRGLDRYIRRLLTVSLQTGCLCKCSVKACLRFIDECCTLYETFAVLLQCVFYIKLGAHK